LLKYNLLVTLCTFTFLSFPFFLVVAYSNKKAVLSQRWPRDAPCSIWVLWNKLRVPGYAHS